MTGRSEKDGRSHGEGYPETSDADAQSEEERYGVKPDAPRSNQRGRRKPGPAQPPPSHERHGRS
jgi:hypothetical protein